MTQGELLGKVEGKDANWLMLYNPQVANLELSGKSQGYEVEQPAGFLIWRQPESEGGQVVAAWDYDGHPLSPDQPLTRGPYDMRQFFWDDFVRAENEGYR